MNIKPTNIGAQQNFTETAIVQTKANNENDTIDFNSVNQNNFVQDTNLEALADFNNLLSETSNNLILEQLSSSANSNSKADFGKITQISDTKFDVGSINGVDSYEFDSKPTTQKKSL